MYDIWGFLLQTLSVSGVAVVILLLRKIFNDKLSPRWHWSIWLVQGVVILLPIGLMNRYVLINWPVVVEMIKGYFKDQSITQLTAPIPLRLGNGLFMIYALGVWTHWAFYGIAYGRLCLHLRNLETADERIMEQVQRVAGQYQLPIPRRVYTQEVPCAYVSGLWKPVLVVPKEEVPDVVILHELLHLKNHDTCWTVLVCILRSLHWCNPLIVYCAHQALNDMEASCDQSVLEQLEGESRREYGYILLNMIYEDYTKTPGSTCLNNGRKNIIKRMEAIGRFKRYPKGMKLVSMCAIIVFLSAVLTGTQPDGVQAYSGWIRYDIAVARTTACRTSDAAFDAYAKAVITDNGCYRLLCMPQAEQYSVMKTLFENKTPYWSGELPVGTLSHSYYFYNIREKDNTYEGLLVIPQEYPLEWEEAEPGMMKLAVQKVKVYEENHRWVATPLDDWKMVDAVEQDLQWGCMELPGFCYIGNAAGFDTEVVMQTIYWSDFHGDTTPDPTMNFLVSSNMTHTTLTHTGTEEDRESIEHLGVTVAPLYKRSEMEKPIQEMNEATYLGSYMTEEETMMEEDWGPVVEIGGGGSTMSPAQNLKIPPFFRAQLMINQELAADFELGLQEEDAP